MRKKITNIFVLLGMLRRITSARTQSRTSQAKQHLLTGEKDKIAESLVQSRWESLQNDNKLSYICYMNA